MHKVYIRSCITKKYLNPIYGENRWVDFDNATYYLVESIDTLEASDLVDEALFYDDLVELIYFNNELEVIISNTEHISSLNKKILKIDFNNFNCKKFEHYIIFNFLMGNDIYHGINIGKKHKFDIFLNKINFLIKMINNYDLTYKYLKMPFPSLNKKDFYLELKKLKEMF